MESVRKSLDEMIQEVKMCGVVGETTNNGKHLTPVRHPTSDVFLTEIFSGKLRNSIDSMSYPLFALKSGDMQIRTYGDDSDVKVMIKPDAEGGIATIYDKDIWIYCISQLMSGINRGEAVTGTLRFIAHDFLMATNRGVSKDDYQRLEAALVRLQGTSIRTNLHLGKKRSSTMQFNLIESWRIERNDKGRMQYVEVTLPQWLFQSIKQKYVLSMSPDYFRLRKALDRRIYELCRKYCGKQECWKISIDVLHQKSGSRTSLKDFRRNIKLLAESNEMPDYFLQFNPEKDQLEIESRTRY